MTKKQENKIRKQLNEKLADLTGNTSRRDGLIAERANDPMDQLQARVDLDMAVRFVNTDFQTRRAVELAIKALDEGEYGTCRDCGDPINPKRLDAIAWTTLCIHCQEAHDAFESEFREAA